MDGVGGEIGAERAEDVAVGGDLRRDVPCRSAAGQELAAEPLRQRGEVEDLTITAATEDLVGRGAVVHEHVGASADGQVTMTAAVDGGLVAVALARGCLHINIGVSSDAGVVVAAIDGILHDGVVTQKVDAGDIVVTVA